MSADYCRDLAAAVETVLASVAAQADAADYAAARSTIIYAFSGAEQAATAGDAFMLALGVLAYGVGIAHHHDRPAVAAILLRTIETVAVQHIREHVITDAMTGLGVDLAQVADELQP